MKIEHENSSKKLCTVIDPATSGKIFFAFETFHMDKIYNI